MRKDLKWWWILLGSEYLAPDVNFTLESMSLISHNQLNFGIGKKIDREIPIISFRHQNPRSFQENDILYGNGNMQGLLVSRKFREIASESKIENAQYLPAKIVDEKKRILSSEYYVFNILEPENCFDINGSNFGYDPQYDLYEIFSIELDEKKLNNSGKLIVRSKECPPIIAISGVLKERLELSGITGTKFLLPEEWTEKMD